MNCRADYFLAFCENDRPFSECTIRSLIMDWATILRERLSQNHLIFSFEKVRENRP